MAKDRGGSTHFFAALLVTCGILSFGLLEWRLENAEPPPDAPRGRRSVAEAARLPPPER